jgi:nitrate reductase delta subunit
MNHTKQSATDLSITLRVLARLLQYPDAGIRAHLQEMRAALHGARTIGRERLAELDALIDSQLAQSAIDAEADYVQLFDCGRATSLHLFEHVHGDSRERGPAMIDLAQTYEAAGLFLAEGELPDYLPVMLEYASTQPPAQARALLSEVAHILNAIFNALHHHHAR